jgi:hypothetical protein
MKISAPLVFVSVLLAAGSSVGKGTLPSIGFE